MTIPTTYQCLSQRGVALVVSLVMLVAITLIGVFVMSNSHLEWLMTNNSRFQSDAFMLAEATLKAAEDTIPDDPASIAWGNPFYNDAPLADPFYSDAAPLLSSGDPNQLSNWNNFTTSASDEIGAPSGTTNNYVIDYLGCTIATPPVPLGKKCGDLGIGSIFTYRVWARSTNGNGASRIIRSTYAKTMSDSGVKNKLRIGFTEISS